MGTDRRKTSNCSIDVRNEKKKRKMKLTCILGAWNAGSVEWQLPRRMETSCRTLALQTHTHTHRRKTSNCSIDVRNEKKKTKNEVDVHTRRVECGFCGMA